MNFQILKANFSRLDDNKDIIILPKFATNKGKSKILTLNMFI